MTPTTQETPTMRHTFTRTVHASTPANPYLVCEQAGDPIHRFTHTGDHEGPLQYEPCGHTGDYRNTCPSWSPVDGCRCAAQLGEVPHGPGRTRT